MTPRDLVTKLEAYLDNPERDGWAPEDKAEQERWLAEHGFEQFSPWRWQRLARGERGARDSCISVTFSENHSVTANIRCAEGLLQTRGETAEQVVGRLGYQLQSLLDLLTKH